MTARRHNIIITLLCLIALGRVAKADSLHNLVHEGNALYDKEHFNEAIKAYDQALVDNPQSPEPKFNKANCYFRLDDLTKAVDLYNEAAAESKDMSLVEKAKYNLGNCHFERGVKQKDSDLQKAVEDLQASIRCWRGVLEIRPENEKAAQNIEVARLIIKDIIDQINKQKEQQQQQAQKQQQLQEQLKALAEQQKALAQKTQQTKEQADQGQINSQQAEQRYQQQSQEQDRIKDETEQALQQVQQQGANANQTQSMQQAGSELEQAINNQAKAQSDLNAFQGDQAVDSQNKAVKHLENALKALSQRDSSGPQQNQEQQGQQQKQQSSQPQPSDQTNEEEKSQQQNKQQAAAAAAATAQEILDKEQQEKKQRQILQHGGYQNVEKDW